MKSKAAFLYIIIAFLLVSYLPLRVLAQSNKSSDLPSDNTQNSINQDVSLGQQISNLKYQQNQIDYIYKKSSSSQNRQNLIAVSGQLISKEDDLLLEYAYKLSDNIASSTLQSSEKDDLLNELNNNVQSLQTLSIQIQNAKDINSLQNIKNAYQNDRDNLNAISQKTALEIIINSRKNEIITLQTIESDLVTGTGNISLQNNSSIQNLLGKTQKEIDDTKILIDRDSGYLTSSANYSIIKSDFVKEENTEQNIKSNLQEIFNLAS